jgi:hypothetical protein
MQQSFGHGGWRGVCEEGKYEEVNEQMGSHVLCRCAVNFNNKVDTQRRRNISWLMLQ